MSCSISLYPDNSIAFGATITNPFESPIYVNDATVQMTVFNEDGTEVAGQTWPITLGYVASSNGEYQTIVAPISGITAGSLYKLRVTATTPGGLQGQWDGYARATVRGC